MQPEHFSEMLSVGGKTNSLGRVDEVIGIVLQNKLRLDELYGCMFGSDPWIRMRAADAFEKICREHPEWIEPYIDRMQAELSDDNQPSIQWHLAQVYIQVQLTDPQKQRALQWLTGLISTTRVDWIVAVESMKALVYFTGNGDFDRQELIRLIRAQLHHKSKSVVKKAGKLLDELA